MSNYRALFNQTPHTMSFIFATSQMVKERLITEFFYVVQDERKEIHKGGLTVTYPSDVLSSIAKPNPIDYGLDAAAEQAKNEIALIFMNKYFRDTEGPGQGVDLRFKFVFGNFRLGEASAATLALCAPDEEHFSFIYQTKNGNLKDFLKKAFLIKKVIQVTPVSKI